MSEPFLSEIKIMAFNFPPKGWALCNGQFLPINQNQALFALLGTTYGGNGVTNFALPNLRGRVPIHMGNGHNLGEAAGSTAVTINQTQLPSHAHFVNATATAPSESTNVPDSSKYLSKSTVDNLYRAPTNLVSMSSQAVSSVGGSQPHNNMQPYLALNFCIALQGIFPSPS